MALKESNKNRKHNTLEQKIAELPEDRQQAIAAQTTDLVDEHNLHIGSALDDFANEEGWNPLPKLAPKETEETVREVDRAWKPIDQLAPHENEETYKEYLASLNQNS